MTDIERHDLSQAYNTLVSHQLWRRGYSSESSDPESLGVAIDRICGAVLDYISLDIRSQKTENHLKIAEKILEMRSADIAIMKSEINRLRGILAANCIKYKKGATK